MQYAKHLRRNAENDRFPFLPPVSVETNVCVYMYNSMLWHFITFYFVYTHDCLINTSTHWAVYTLNRFHCMSDFRPEHLYTESYFRWKCNATRFISRSLPCFLFVSSALNRYALVFTHTHNNYAKHEHEKRSKPKNSQSFSISQVPFSCAIFRILLDVVVFIQK